MVEKSENNEVKGKEQVKGHLKDPVSGITGGLIIILLGILFLLANFGYIWWNIWWAYFLLGLGFIFILEVVIRSAAPQFHRPITGKLIAGTVLIFIGAGSIYGIGEWWPLILVGVGVAVILGALWKGKKPAEHE